MNEPQVKDGAGITSAGAGSGPEPLLLRPEQAALHLGISRSKLFGMLQKGEIPSLTIGRCRRIPAAALERWIQERTS